MFVDFHFIKDIYKGLSLQKLQMDRYKLEILNAKQAEGLKWSNTKHAQLEATMHIYDSTFNQIIVGRGITCKDLGYVRKHAYCEA